MDENTKNQDPKLSIPISKSILETKMKFYSQTSIMVHIKLASGQFRNGHVMSKVAPGVWCVSERKLGLVNIFEDEIVNVEDYATENKK